MNVLITGATGYLGGRVAAALLRAGHEVTALCRPGREAAAPPGCRTTTGDLLEPSSLRAALRDREALVHMGAMVARWSPDRSGFDRVNVSGTAAILDAARDASVRRILYTSSIVALGPTRGAPADEDTPRSTGRFCTDYERTKWKGLLAARERAAAGAPLVIVYPGVVYGPGAPTEGDLLGPMLRDHLAGRLRARLGRGDLRICYAYAEDVARGHVLALARGAPGRGYILGGENTTQDDLFDRLRTLTGQASPRLRVPYRVGEVLGALLVLRARVTGRPPALTPGVVRTFRSEWAYSSERAAREIGYAPTPLLEGLRRTIEALREERGAERGPATAGRGA